MKRPLKICFVVSLVLVCLFVYWKKEPRIHQLITYVRERMNPSVEDSVRKHTEDDLIDTLPVLMDTPDAWYTKYQVLAHGGGGINGKEISDSREALDEHFVHGTRLFDVDIQCTTDSVLVLRHSWEDNTEQDVLLQQVFRSRRVASKNLLQEYILLDYPRRMDLREFVSHRIYNMFHSMTVDDLFDWMKEHPDVYIFPDIKDKELISKFVKEAQNAGLDTLMSHIIIRIYDYDDYQLARRLVGTDQIMLKHFDMSNDTYANVIKFCTTNHIHAVALTLTDADDNILERFKEKGVHVYVAVVDHLSDYDYFRKKGATGIVSNWLYEEHIINYQYKNEKVD